MNNFINASNLKDVKIIDVNSVYIENGVKVGKNVIIYPNNFLLGNTTIGDNCIIMPFNIIINSNIGNNVNLTSSQIENSIIKAGASVGPFAHIRPNSTIGENCKIGNFVEVKASTLNENTKASHLAYIGDANVGDNCNIGCGAIFVNYNGKEKLKTQVGSNCFIGSNVNIIAPVNISNNSYICAGSTLTKNTQEYDFVIARTRETIKPNTAQKYLKPKT